MDANIDMGRATLRHGMTAEKSLTCTWKVHSYYAHAIEGQSAAWKRTNQLRTTMHQVFGICFMADKSHALGCCSTSRCNQCRLFPRLSMQLDSNNAWSSLYAHHFDAHPSPLLINRSPTRTFPNSHRFCRVIQQNAQNLFFEISEGPHRCSIAVATTSTFFYEV